MENDREGMVLRRAHIVRPFSFARMQKMFGKFSDGGNIIVGCPGARPRHTVCKFIGNIYLVGEHSVLPRWG